MTDKRKALALKVTYYKGRSAAKTHNDMYRTASRVTGRALGLTDDEIDAEYERGLADGMFDQTLKAIGGIGSRTAHIVCDCGHIINDHDVELPGRVGCTRCTCSYYHTSQRLYER